MRGVKQLSLLFADRIDPVNEIVFTITTNMVNAFGCNNLEAVLFPEIIYLLDIRGHTQRNLASLGFAFVLRVEKCRG